MTEPTIANLDQLCTYFGADDPTLLNKAIYKGTSCGASISVQTPDGEWHHNGQDWTGITSITAFTLQTIVEGSDVTVDSDEFTLPVYESAVAAWMEEMEKEADFYWKRDNASYYSILDKDHKHILWCEWQEFDTEPRVVARPDGNEATDADKALAKSAYEYLYSDDSPRAMKNPDGTVLGWTVDHGKPYAIPNTEYFVQEEETPDIDY